MGKSWRDRFNNLPPTVSLALKILGLTAALITVGTALGEWTGVGSILSKSVRDALSDFLTADVEVWHLLVAVGSVIVAGLIVIRLRESSRSKRYEVKMFGVLWPIGYSRTYGISVGKPMCRKDRSTLGVFRLDKLVALSSDWEDNLTASGMNFGCPKEGCGRKYDLSNHKYHMADMVNLVFSVAMSKFRSAFREPK
jgi:hypothetical protein